MGFQAASGLAPRRSWTHRWIPRKSWARWVRSPGVGLGQRTSSWWIVTFWTIYLEILEDFWCFNGRCIKKISEMIPGHNRSKYIPVKNILQTPYMWLYICIWLQMNNYIKHPNWFKTFIFTRLHHGRFPEAWPCGTSPAANGSSPSLSFRPDGPDGSVKQHLKMCIYWSIWLLINMILYDTDL